jgi:hypothetical protein
LVPHDREGTVRWSELLESLSSFSLSHGAMVKQLVASMELMIVCKSESVSESGEAGPGGGGGEREMRLTLGGLSIGESALILEHELCHCRHQRMMMHFE